MRDPRLGRLLEAVLAVARDLDLETVLGRVVDAGCGLVDARYGALGVIGEDGHLAAFVHRGIDARTAERIGHLPEGRGILGLLIDEPEPLRLDDISTHEASYGFPEHHPPMHAFLGAPIQVGERVFGNLYLTEKTGGGSFTPEDEELVVGLAAVAGAAIENARLYDDLRRREAWGDAVLEVTTGVLAGEAAAEVRERVVARARDLVDGTAAVVVAPDEGGGLRVLAGAGEVGGAHHLDLLEGAAWDVVRGEPIRVVDEDEILAGAAIWVPLGATGGVGGALGVRLGTGLTERERQLLASFASQASLSLAHERAQTDLRRLSLIEERERIGRDLHDTVIQRLFATGLSLQAAVRRAEDRPDVAQRLDRAVDEIDETVREIRSTIFALQTSAEEARGIRVAVLEVVDEVAPLLPSTPRLRFDGALDALVPGHVTDQVVPVVRESLTNVAKHARAGTVVLEVQAESGWLVVRVTDDGVGLPVEIGAGFGLGNLRQRAEALGGRVDVAATGPDGGTTVEWTVPIS